MSTTNDDDRTTEKRVDTLELAVGDIRGELRSIDVRLTNIEVVLPTFATKKDLDILRADVKADIAEFKEEVSSDMAGLRVDMAELRAEMKTDMSELRTEVAQLKAEVNINAGELRADMAELRAEVKTDIAELRTDMASLQAQVKINAGELSADMAELRAEVKIDIAELRADIHQVAASTQRWMLATVLGMFFGFGSLFLGMSNLIKPLLPTAAPAAIVAPPSPSKIP